MMANIHVAIPNINNITDNNWQMPICQKFANMHVIIITVMWP